MFAIGVWTHGRPVRPASYRSRTPLTVSSSSTSMRQLLLREVMRHHRKCIVDRV